MNIKEKELEFQEAQKNWNIFKDLKSWNIMWFRVFDCCKNIAKTKANGIVLPDLEEKCLDATCKIMQKIKDGYNINKLSSFCYLWVIGELYNKKIQKWERSLDIETILNNINYTCTEGLTEVYLEEGE